LRSELSVVDRAWLAHDAIRIGKPLMQRFGDREGVHAVIEVKPHQAVAAATVDVVAAAAGDENACAIAVGVEESLQELLPASVLVQLVEQQRRNGFPQSVEPERGVELGGAGEHLLTVVDVVPVEVEVGVAAAGRRLAHLRWPADEGYLPMRGQMLGQHRVVHPLPRRHADRYRWHRKMVKTVLR